MGNYKEQLSRFYKQGLGRNECFSFGQTPELLQKYGMSDLELIMTPQVARKATRSPDAYGQGHNLPRRVMNDLEKQIMNPVAIIRNPDKNSLVLVSDAKDHRGDNVIVTIHKNQNSATGKVNKITSVYGKKDFAKYYAKHSHQGNIVYKDEKRIGKLRLSVSHRLQEATTTTNPTTTIPQPPPPVNTQNEKNQNNFKAAPAQSRPQHFTMAGGSLKRQVDEWRGGRGGAGAGAEKGKEGKGKDGRDGKN